MQGLDLTFETLGKSRNDAAVEVMLATLDGPEATNRRRAIAALMCRRDPRASRLLLARWSELSEDEIELVRGRKTWMSPAIEAALGPACDQTTASDETIKAIDAAEALALHTALPNLIQLSESVSVPDSALRDRVNSAVKSIADQLGREARRDRDQRSLRTPVITQLSDSVRRFDTHGNDDLVEAFLIASTWGDGELRQMLADGGPSSNLICRVLQESPHPSVIELLVGFLRRRNLPDAITYILRKRPDATFRDAFLRSIGGDPSQVVLRHLQLIGVPRCLQGGESILRELPIDCRPALVHVHVAGNPDYVEALQLVAATAEQGTQDCLAAATMALSRCELPNPNAWMRAALHLSDDDQQSNEVDETARLLRRFVRLLDKCDPAFHRILHRSLSALHGSEMLPQFQSLRPRSRRRLGKVVMQIDPEALDQVRDGLRHPVLTKRLDAIAMADALGAVDLLGDAFTHIAREDHQEARIRAAEAMATASSDETMQLLEEMLGLPPCPVRDAAIVAIERRRRDSRSNTMKEPEVATQRDPETNLVASALVKSSQPRDAPGPKASLGETTR
jgi:hypothetical protein